MANSNREKQVDFNAMINSPPFRAGVLDVQLGRWRDQYGTWRDFDAQAVYETGRLATAALGRPCRTLIDYIQACQSRPFPPNRPR